MSDFSKCWRWIERARREGWIHKRRNLRMNEVPLDRILLRVAEEVGELSQAHTRDGNELEELADCFCILMHFAMAKGFTPDQVTDKMGEKLSYHIVPPEND